MELSIISPCYNEAKNIKKFIEKVFKILTKKKVELIIIDDDSSDRTYLIIKSLQKKYKNLRCILRKQKPRDLSKSCFLGIESAKYKYILIMDSDLQHNPQDIIKLYNKLEKTDSDIVVGVRKLLKRNKALSVYRQLASIIITYIFNLILKKKTSDPMSGFFIFKKKVYDKNTKYFANGFKILVDLIYNSKKNISVKDQKINFNFRKKNLSKMNLRVLILIIMFLINKIFK